MAKKEAGVSQNSKAQMHELCQAREVTLLPVPLVDANKLPPPKSQLMYPFWKISDIGAKVF